MSQAILVEEANTGHSVKDHPFGGRLHSICRICKYLISPHNSARYCQCNVYSHGSCIAYTFGSEVDGRQFCEICKAPYNLYFQDKTILRPLSQMNCSKILALVGWAGMVAVLCLLLIDVINHSIDNESVSGELIYFLFATYMALFVIATLACVSKIILAKACIVVGLDPYYRMVIYLEKEQESGHELRDVINDTEALTTK